MTATLHLASERDGPATKRDSYTTRCGYAILSAGSCLTASARGRHQVTSGRQREPGAG